MVVYDQLRISDDGQRLYLDAHVNQAEQFADVYISKVTVCTENEVSKLYPEQVPSKFIYQQDVHPVDTLEPLYSRVQYLSEYLVKNEENADGGWDISNDLPVEITNNYLSVVFSGKFSSLDSEYAPKLVVATRMYRPSGGMENPGILFTIDGEHHDEKGHQTWLFKGKGAIDDNSALSFYLFKQESEGVYTPVSLDTTDNVNFLHFLWQVWSLIPGTSQKSVHLVLDKASFNEALNNTNNGEAIDSSKPIATQSFDSLDLSHNMFFVYVETEGGPSYEVPCILDRPVTLGVTFDYGLIYQQAMGYTKELTDNCDVPRSFIDFILNFDALKLAVETEHWISAIGFWEGLTQNKSFDNNGLTKPCGCHG